MLSMNTLCPVCGKDNIFLSNTNCYDCFLKYVREQFSSTMESEFNRLENMAPEDKQMTEITWEWKVGEIYEDSEGSQWMLVLDEMQVNELKDFSGENALDLLFRRGKSSYVWSDRAGRSVNGHLKIIGPYKKERDFKINILANEHKLWTECKEKKITIGFVKAKDVLEAYEKASKAIESMPFFYSMKNDIKSISIDDITLELDK